MSESLASRRMSLLDSFCGKEKGRFALRWLLFLSSYYTNFALHGFSAEEELETGKRAGFYLHVKEPPIMMDTKYNI